MTVFGGTWAGKPGQRCLATLLPLPLRRDELGTRVDGDLTGVAVEGDECARGDLGRALELNDRRDAHLGGQDRGVARATPGCRDDADDEGPVERRRLGRSQVLGDDDRRRGERRHPGRRDAKDGSHRSGPDIAQVRDALGEISTQGLELRSDLLDRSADGRGLPRPAGQVLGRAFEQGLVAGDEGGRLEDLLGGVIGRRSARLEVGGNRLEGRLDRLGRLGEVAGRRLTCRRLHRR